MDKRLIRSVFVLLSARGFTSSTGPWHSSVPLHDTGPAPLMAALLSELCKCWVTVAALAVTAKRRVASCAIIGVLRSREKSALTWEDLCVCGRLWGREARPPLRFPSFSLHFSSPPWVFGILDCMVYADLTAIVSTFHSFFSNIVLEHRWCQMFGLCFSRDVDINSFVRLSVQHIKWTNEWFMDENSALHLDRKILF